MLDHWHQPDQPANSIPAINRRERKRWQVGLRTLFLLMAAIAVWLAYFNNRRHIPLLEARIKALLPMAHELIVDDQTKIAVVQLEAYWLNDNRWDVYLPDGRFRLCVATHKIGIGSDPSELAPIAKSEPIPSGRHRLALERRRDGDVWRVAVACDGTELLAVEEPEDWYPDAGWFGGGYYPVSEQLAADEPVMLFRIKFSRKDSSGQTSTPRGPTEGILLWIEKTGESKAAP